MPLQRIVRWGFNFALVCFAVVLPSQRAQADIILEAPVGAGAYYGLYSTQGIAAAFTLANVYHVTSIDVVVRTPAVTSFTTFHYSLQNALTNPSTIFAAGSFSVPLGTSTQSLAVNQTLVPGSYYLIVTVPGYFGTPVTPGDVNGWLLSSGVYNTTGGTITSLQAPNPAPTFRVNGSLAPPPPLFNDLYDDDEKADIAVWRPTTGIWYVIRSSDGTVRSREWGLGTAPHNDVPVPGDYDGDGTPDLAVWRPSTGVWYVLRSSDGSMLSQPWGAGFAPYHDIPVPADYDGDGKTDIAVWRPSLGIWYILRSSDGHVVTQAWGAGFAPYHDIPVPADYDGDGKADIAVWRASSGVWYILRSSDGSVMSQAWGAGFAPYNDVPVPGDYDGDGRTDIAVWRASSGIWYILRSSDGHAVTQPWGAGVAPYHDIPVPADYDGDGKTDIAVWRASTGVWYVLRSSDGHVITQSWGAGYAPYNDMPVASLPRPATRQQAIDVGGTWTLTRTGDHPWIATYHTFTVTLVHSGTSLTGTILPLGRTIASPIEPLGSRVLPDGTVVFGSEGFNAYWNESSDGYFRLFLQTPDRMTGNCTTAFTCLSATAIRIR